MWKRNQNTYGNIDAAVTPYQQAAQVWDDRIGSARVQAKNWRLAALMSISMASLLAGAFIWQSSQSLVTPYVVEIEQGGSVRAVRAATLKYEPTDAQIGYQLGEFIHNVRSISIDPIVVKENWLQAYNYTTDQGALTLNAYARDNDPFAEIGRRSVSVKIISVVRSSEDSFEIRWRETAYRNGVEQSADTFTASLSIVLESPTDELTLHRNPLGIYVHGLNWSKDLSQ
ncbi:MAG: conjugal transfer protein TrbF [Alphaproteobacteria bacterium]|nr:MAG: conjugal transfer protein TrbF [Alphaproteobacteria bacterium]